MKAYVVTVSGLFFNDAGWDKDSRLLKVFSTEEKAKEYIEGVRNRSIQVNEFVWDAEQDLDNELEIQEIEIDE